MKFCPSVEGVEKRGVWGLGLRVEELQQVPTRNFLIRIINLPASHLTTWPGISQNMKSRRRSSLRGKPSSSDAPLLRKCHPLSEGKAPSQSDIIRQVQLLGQLLDVLWWLPKRKSCSACLFLHFHCLSLLENVFSGQLCATFLPFTGI